MKNTKENVVLLLKAEIKNVHIVMKNEKLLNGRTTRYYRLKKEADTMQHAIWLLTEQEFFDRFVELFQERIEEINKGEKQ